MLNLRPPPPPIFDDITSTIGNTPIIRVKSISTLASPIELSNIELLVKLEYLNSLSGSIKDRVAKRILEGTLLVFRSIVVKY